MDTRTSQRATGRFVPVWELRVTDRETGEPVGVLVDISMTGAKFMGREAVEPGGTVDLCIELPPDTAKLTGLCFECRICWCTESSAPGLWLFGVEFEGDLSREELIALGALLYTKSI